MRTIDDTPPEQRFLMVAQRLSPSRWADECRAVRDWLANPPDTLSKSDAEVMLGTIGTPLPRTHHALIIIYCYADIPAGTRWNTAFDPSLADRHETINAELQYGVLWHRAVFASLAHGHHQVAVLAFPDGLPQLLASLPVDSDIKAADYIGLCASEDLPAIRHQLANVASIA